MRFSLGYQVLAAVVLGSAVGLFFGPFCNAIQPIGEIYFMLLQMVALPYITVSLIHGLGSMTPALGKQLLKRGWPFWLTIWAIIFAAIFALNTMIPAPYFTSIDAGADESAKLARNFLNYLVPENPLYDLVNNIIPAIASFGLIFGIALMHLRSKEPILSVLEKGTQLIEKILEWLAIASPIGIFTHFAVMFGTVSFEEVYSLAFYVAAFIAASLIVTFWVLPALISSLTPLTYRELLTAFKTICILPFATALPTLALPFIILYMKKLGVKHHEGDPHFQATSQTVLPICYSFGQIGNCMILFFILFLSFYFRHPFTGWEKAVLSIFMVPMSFGSSTTSISTVAFLIDQLKFPSDAIDMFKQATTITMNFQVLLSAASIFTFIVLTLYAVYGSLRFDWKRLFLHFAAIALVSVIAIAIVKRNLHIRDEFQGAYMDLKIGEVIDNPVHARILLQRPAAGQGGGDPFDRILRSGILRVGYSPLDIPFSYINSSGELVGYDIAYAYQLARDLDCTLEFIPIDYDHFIEQVETGEFDIAMSAIAVTEERIKSMNFSEAYEEQNLVLIVPTRRVQEFLDLPDVESRKGLRIVAYGMGVNVAKRHFPYATVTELPSFSTLMLPLLNKSADAAIWIKIQGFAWCINRPQFVPVDYGGQLGKCYLAYPVSLAATQWISFVNHWLSLKEQSGFKDLMARYWLKGEDLEEQEPRWSIMRNVLHWVD